MSPKAKIIRADQPIEFVGFNVSPHGLRLRKKTVKHMKRSMKHVARLYADGVIGLESAMDSIICYRGMTTHCNANYLREWIENNIVLQRGEGAE